jgi:hypothetical protein
MKELHDKSASDSLNELKEGQPGLLCSNKKSEGCPSLRYYFVKSKFELETVFDILFDSMFNL